ncbi:MAG: hypothetical protein R3261_14460 [Alphaproteobacteria bacterium]|nr:hypothetical protein [Alphaproteobacteria bacterium]
MGTNLESGSGGLLQIFRVPLDLSLYLRLALNYGYLALFPAFVLDIFLWKAWVLIPFALLFAMLLAKVIIGLTRFYYIRAGEVALTVRVYITLFVLCISVPVWGLLEWADLSPIFVAYWGWASFIVASFSGAVLMEKISRTLGTQVFSD